MCFSDEVGALLELDATERDTEELCAVFSGSRVLEGVRLLQWEFEFVRASHSRMEVPLIVPVLSKCK